VHDLTVMAATTTSSTAASIASMEPAGFTSGESGGANPPPPPPPPSPLVTSGNLEGAVISNRHLQQQGHGLRSGWQQQHQGRRGFANVQGSILPPAALRDRLAFSVVQRPPPRSFAIHMGGSGAISTAEAAPAVYQPSPQYGIFSAFEERTPSDELALLPLPRIEVQYI
jgi:hypothetical protein